MQDWILLIARPMPLPSHYENGSRRTGSLPGNLKVAKLQSSDKRVWL
jgi:hypothetical protein